MHHEWPKKNSPTEFPSSLWYTVCFTIKWPARYYNIETMMICDFTLKLNPMKAKLIAPDLSNQDHFGNLTNVTVLILILLSLSGFWPMSVFDYTLDLNCTLTRLKMLFSAWPRDFILQLPKQLKCVNSQNSKLNMWIHKILNWICEFTKF